MDNNPTQCLGYAIYFDIQELIQTLKMPISMLSWLQCECKDGFAAFTLKTNFSPKCQSIWHSPDIEKDSCSFEVICVSSSKTPSFWKINQNRALQDPDTALNGLYHVVIFYAYVMKNQNMCLGMIFMKSHDILNKNYQKFQKKKFQ